MAHGEDLSVELDSLDRICASRLRLLELLDEVLRLADVLEHGLDLRHDVVAALDLQLLDDRLLRLVITAHFVEEAFGEQHRVSLDELVTAIEAAKEIDDGVDRLVDFGHALLPEALLLLMVEVERDELRHALELVHEDLERLVAGLLEAHVIFEADRDEVIDLSLQLQYLLRHLQRLVLERL